MHGLILKETNCLFSMPSRDIMYIELENSTCYKGTYEYFPSIDELGQKTDCFSIVKDRGTCDNY